MRVLSLPRGLLVACVLDFLSEAAKEGTTVVIPLEGWTGSDTYAADAANTTCTDVAPYPTGDTTCPGCGVGDTSTIEQVIAYCSSLANCGGFIYTTSTANGGGNALARYCTPHSFVVGTPSGTSAIGFSRLVYPDGCGMKVQMPVTLVHPDGAQGTLSFTRDACLLLGRGLTPGARVQSPRPSAAQRRSRPVPTVTISSVEYTVGVDVFTTEAAARAASRDDTFHTMVTSDANFPYYMPGSSHALTERSEKPFALDGYYPLYVTENGAKGASDNGLATAYGPASANAVPTIWTLAPHMQTYWLPADGATLYLGTYPTPFALDGYFPLYSTEADAQLVSSSGVAQSHGPWSSTGHPQRFSTGYKRYYMPAAGYTKYYGDYYPGFVNTSLYDFSANDSLYAAVFVNGSVIDDATLASLVTAATAANATGASAMSFGGRRI